MVITKLRLFFTGVGPDFIGQEAVHSDGVFHISGPVLVQNSAYTIQVSIVANSNSKLQNPVSDTFVLPPNLSKKQLVIDRRDR